MLHLLEVFVLSVQVNMSKVMCGNVKLFGFSSWEKYLF